MGETDIMIILRKEKKIKKYQKKYREAKMSQSSN